MDIIYHRGENWKVRIPEVVEQKVAGENIMLIIK